jgi:hypothetical protein
MRDFITVNSDDLYLLQKAAVYGNPSIFRFMIDKLSLQPVKPENLLKGDMPEEAQRSLSVLLTVLEYFQNYYFLIYDNDFNQRDIYSWCHSIAPDWLPQRYFTQQGIDPAKPGDSLLKACGEYTEIIDIFVEFGVPIHENNCERIFREVMNPDDPVLQKIKALAESSPFSTVLVVNHFSAADLFEADEDMERRLTLTEGHTQTLRMQAFDQAMLLLIRNNPALKIIEQKPGRYVLSGPENTLRDISESLTEYYTELLLRFTLDKDSLANHSNLEAALGPEASVS